MNPDDAPATDPRFWNQIGPFGGWLAATLLEAITRSAQEPWPVLSVQVHFLGAVKDGALDIRVQPVRRQRTLALWRAQLHQDGQVAVEAEAILAAARTDQPAWPASAAAGRMPAMPAPHTLPRWHGVDGIAPFVRAFDYRLFSGAPFEAATQADTTGWLRLEAPTAFSAPAKLLMLTDAWFPALWSALPRPAPVTTVSLHVLFNPQALPRVGPDNDYLAVHHRADAVAHGWGHECGNLWWPDGQLAAQAQQLTWIDLKKPHQHWPDAPPRRAVNSTTSSAI